MMTAPTTLFSHAGFAGLLGVARRDITPPMGIYARCWGAAQHDTAEGIHCPLTVTAVTFQEHGDAAPLVLLALDLCLLGDPQENGIIEALLAAFALDRSRLIVNCAHTHAGAGLRRVADDLPGGDLLAPWYEFVSEKIVAATGDALAHAQSGVVTWAYGRCTLATSRDLPSPLPHEDRILTGFHPDGAADDTLLVGRVTDAGGGIIATIVNYACHPTTLAWENRLISPDWVGAMRETVEAQTDHAPCLFLQGASGELAPRDQYTGDVGVADRNGQQVGFAVLSTLVGMLPPGVNLSFSGVVESGAPLAMWRHTPARFSPHLSARCIQIDLPIKADFPTLSEIENALSETTDRALQERLHRKHTLRLSLGEAASAWVSIWFWCVGESIFVAHINEAYSLLQTKLRCEFPGVSIVVMNLSNGSCGYLPPAELYARDLYSAWQTPFAPGGLERLIDACKNEIRALIHLSQP